MKISESELNREMAAIGDSGEASSFEDFWMFLSFAMVLVAFVLMGYVSYLKSIEIDNVKKIVELEGKLSDVKDELKDDEALESAIDILVHKGADDKVYLTIDDDKDSRFSYKELAGVINSRKFEKNSTVLFYVHAPGNYTYEEVFQVNILLKSTDVLGDRAVKKVVANTLDPRLLNK